MSCALHEQIAADIRSCGCRIVTMDEAGLQQTLACLLRERGYAFDREVVLGRDRLDFLVHGGTCIETKIGGGTSALLRQLSRYTMHACVTAILVVSTRSRHTNLPATLGGKPLLCVPLFWSNM